MLQVIAVLLLGTAGGFGLGVLLAMAVIKLEDRSRRRRARKQLAVDKLLGKTRTQWQEAKSQLFGPWR